MLRQLRRDLLVFLLKLTLNVDNRRLEEFGYGLPHNRAYILALLHFFHPLLQQLLVVRQLEIPVGDRLHRRLFACQRAYRVNEVFGHILVSHIALVCVAFFRGAAVNGAFAHYLSSVEKNACFLVKKLHCRYFFKLSLFKKGGEEFLGEFSMDLLAPVKSRSGKQVRLYRIFFKCLRLLVVV